MVCLQSYVIMLGGHLLETEIKRIRQISGFESAASQLILSSGGSCTYIHTYIHTYIRFLLWFEVKVQL